VGVEDGVGIECLLEGPERTDLGVGAREVEPPPLGRADAVLGADAATGIGDQVENPVIHLVVVGVEAGHVHVDIAVPGVSEQPGARQRGDRAYRCRNLVDELGQRTLGQRDVELVRGVRGC
jgi:hypothetical protein